MEADALTSVNHFRRERLQEPLELYSEFFNVFASVFQKLVAKLPALATDPIDPDLLASLVTGKQEQNDFRYLTTPPIYEDDLETVAATSLAPKALRTNPANAKLVRDTVLSIIDPHRFPWIPEKRKPTEHESDRAIVASAALAAAREVETKRRNTSKNIQEAAVKSLLSKVGLKERRPKDIPILTAAPAPGEFCGETRLAGTRADVVARLKDGRVMAIECKVSNSAVNSYKRIVHDTGGKATTWYSQLGRAQIVPCAVLSGVFAPANLATVQNEKGVFLFWQHRLGDLATFVKSVK